MTVVLRCSCQCGFTSAFDTGPTPGSRYELRQCETCRTLTTRLAASAAPDTACPSCRGATAVVGRNDVVCPACRRQSVIIWPAAVAD